MLTKSTLLFCLLMTICCFVYCQETSRKKICITIDDLPVVSYGINEPSFIFGITDGLLEALTTYKIPAIGFVNESKIFQGGEKNESQVEVLNRWLNAGMELGNHTYSHKNYHRTAFPEYTEDILKGEVITKELAATYNSKVHYFRHPFLRAGNSQGAYDSLNAFLSDHGYEVAPVTIDNEDYLFALAYHNAYKTKDQEMMDKIAEAYIQYMEEKLVFYEQMSSNLFGRHIDQILLLHANLLNAQHLADLAELYVDYGYTFASLSEVLEDPAYESKVTNFGDWGISWMDRWAMTAGKKGDFFAGDPQTPEFIQQMAVR